MPPRAHGDCTVRIRRNVAAIPLALLSICALHRAHRAEAQMLDGPSHVITPGAVSSMVQTGGTVALTNWGGLDGSPQINLNVGGRWVQGSTLMVTPTGFSSTFGALPVGTYDAFIVDADGSWYWSAGGLGVTSSSTPTSIWPGALPARYYWSDAICSGSCATSAPYTGNCTNGATVTSLCDSSGNLQQAPCHNGVTYVFPDSVAIMPHVGSVAFDGSTGYCEAPSFALGSTTQLALLGSFYFTSANAGTPDTLLDYHSASPVQFNRNTSNQLITILGGVTNADVTSPTIATGCFIGLGTNSYSSPTNTLSASLDNMTPATATVNVGAIATSANLYIGANGGTGQFAKVNLFEADVVNSAVTTGASSQYNDFVHFENGQIGCDPLPTLTYNSGAQTSNATCGINFTGTGYATGVAVVLDCGGTDYPLTVNGSSSVFITATTPSIPYSGQCSATITNPNGRSQIFANAVTIGSGTNLVCIMGGYAGTWWEGANWSCPSGCTLGNNISQLNDLTGLQNNPAQGTGADQPTVFSLSDPDFGGKPSLASVSPDTMSVNPVIAPGVTATGSIDIAVLKQTSTTGVQRMARIQAGSPVFRLGISNDATGAGAGVPSYLYNGASNQSVWGSALSGPSLVWGGSYGAGTVTTFVDVDDDGASAVVSTFSASPAYWSSAQPSAYLGSSAAHVAYMAHLYANPTTAQAKAICLMLKADFAGSWSCP